MYIKRNLEVKILKFLKSPEIIAIFGPRQSGKTTLMKNLIKNLKKAVFISFEDREILRIFEKETDDFINLYIKGNHYLFIDEFQYAKEGGRILKYIYDTQKIKIVISGSSSADLAIKAIKYLVGRVLVFELYPFDFEEFLRAKDKNYLKVYQSLKKENFSHLDRPLKISPTIHKRLMSYYEEYLIFGGYPRVVLEKDQESKKEILKNIYNTYFLREVKDILGLIDDYKLAQLIKALALQIGELISYEELSRISGYSYLYLKKYLNFLEKTYIVKFIKPFFKNRKTEVVKNPKVYFIDSGLRNLVLKDFRSFDLRIDKGNLFENGVAQELIKQGASFYFWRDKKKNEIDFIIQRHNGEMVAVELKTAMKKYQKSKAVELFRKKYPEIKIYFAFRVSTDHKIKNAYPVYLY